MECCNKEMTIIKTTGQAYTHMCFECGRIETEPKQKKKKTLWEWLGGK